MNIEMKSSLSVLGTSITLKELREFTEDLPDNAKLSIRYVPGDRPFDPDSITFDVTYKKTDVKTSSNNYSSDWGGNREQYR